MTFLPFLAAAVLAATPAYHVDLGRYFPSPVVEQSERASLLTEVADFAATPPTLLNSPAALRAWLQRRDRLLVRLHRHDVFVYLRAERDLDDHADQVADDALSDAMDRLDRAAERTLSSLGKPRLEDWLGRDEGLATYRFFIETSLASGAGKADTPAAATMSAALETLANGYKSLANAAPPRQPGRSPNRNRSSRPGGLHMPPTSRPSPPYSCLSSNWKMAGPANAARSARRRPPSPARV